MVTTRSTDEHADDRPAILLVSEENSDFLLDEFGRYARDYDVRAARSAAEAKAIVKGLHGEGRQLALSVSESVLPDDDVLAMFQRLRTYVPTARRLIAAHWSRFRIDAELAARAEQARVRRGP